MSLNKRVIQDELLIVRCQQGDRQALEDLVRLYEKRLLYYIRRLVDNEQDAWNILQETWLKVLRAIDRLKEPKLLTVWLYHIARNTIMDYRRGKYADMLRFQQDDLMPDIPDDTASMSLENAQLVHHALGQLSPPHREVLTLHFLEELPLEAIAAIINTSVGTVKSRLFYAKQNLKKQIEKEMHNEK